MRFDSHPLVPYTGASGGRPCCHFPSLDPDVASPVGLALAPPVDVYATISESALGSGHIAALHDVGIDGGIIS